jgi:hypothetical protein
MTAVPGSPRPLKGALIGLDPADPLASFVPFQYNPFELTRSLEPQYSRSGHTPAGTQFLAGPPTEMIRLAIELNAADKLGAGDAIAKQFGIYPQLAAIEEMMTPKVATVAAMLAAAAAGSIELVPRSAPITLFIWGKQRIQPVEITSYSVTETYHDARLNPIAAKVDLGLRCLNFQDFNLGDAGMVLAIADMVVKEALAVVGSVSGGLDLLTGGS